MYQKIILVLFGLAYLISPVDLIPDFRIPFLGFLDDGIVLGTIYYMIRYGRLPGFFSRNPKSSDKKKSSPQNSLKTPYDILGIHPGASEKEITAAYKNAIKKYHPDKLSHLGEEFSSLANEKFLEIQKAYEALVKP